MRDWPDPRIPGPSKSSTIVLWIAVAGAAISAVSFLITTVDWIATRL